MSEDINSTSELPELPWLDKGQISCKSYAEYSSCIYASLLGEPRLDYSPHVAELMNLSRIRIESKVASDVAECSQLELDILNEPLPPDSSDWLFLDQFFGPADAANPSTFGY